MDFVDLLKKALGLLGAKKKLVDLVRIDKKSDRIENLVEKCKTKTWLSIILPLYLNLHFNPLLLLLEKQYTLMQLIFGLWTRKLTK